MIEQQTHNPASELSTLLLRLSGELHSASAAMRTIGWEGHSSELASMSALLSIYGHQINSKKDLS